MPVTYGPNETSEPERVKCRDELESSSLDPAMRCDIRFRGVDPRAPRAALERIAQNVGERRRIDPKAAVRLRRAAVADPQLSVGNRRIDACRRDRVHATDLYPRIVHQ